MVTTPLICSECGEGNYRTTGLASLGDAARFDGLAQCGCGHTVSIARDIVPNLEPNEAVRWVSGVLSVRAL